MSPSICSLVAVEVEPFDVSCRSFYGIYGLSVVNYCCEIHQQKTQNDKQTNQHGGSNGGETS